MIMLVALACGDPDGRDDELDVMPVQAGNGVAEVYGSRRDNPRSLSPTLIALNSTKMSIHRFSPATALLLPTWRVRWAS
jgi:hypothetical protein